MKRIFTLGFFIIAMAAFLGCEPALGVLDIGQGTGPAKLKDAAGKTIDLSKINGVTVVAFWMPGDTDSRKGLSDLASALKKSTFKKVTVIAVTRGKDKDEQSGAKKDFAKYKWPFKLAFDSELDVATRFGVTQPLPAYYIVGADHKLKSLPIRKAKGLVRNMSFSDILAAVVAGKNVPRIEFLEVGEDDGPNMALIGKRPPDFSAKDVRGRSFSPAQFKGSASLILLFWSPTCPHCHREIPRIKEFLSKYGDKYKVKAVGIASGNGKDFQRQLEGAITDLMIDFPIIASSDRKLVARYGSEKVPLTYIINKNGVICEALPGEHEDAVKLLKSIFDDPKRMAMK